MLVEPKSKKLHIILNLNTQIPLKLVLKNRSMSVLGLIFDKVNKTYQLPQIERDPELQRNYRCPWKL